jgi:transcriptional regulator with XRE-family HTH domain
MAVEQSSETGARLLRIRRARGKSLAAVAGHAGISTSYLSMLERGERTLDRRSLIVKLADALQVAPPDLTAMPIVAPGNADTAMPAISRALRAILHDSPKGEVLPVEVLRNRVHELLDSCRACQLKQAGDALPALIRDLHSSIDAGQDVAELLDLAVLLHTRGTHSWLRVLGGNVDMRSLVTLVAQHAAERRDHPAMLGLAVWSDALAMLDIGYFDLAQTLLDSVTVPTTSQDETELAGMLALCRSLVAAADQRPADVEAALDEAADLAEHTGEGNAYWLGFGPTNVGLWSMSVALEAGDHDRAVTIAEKLDPQMHPHRSRQAAYWLDYGRALARIRGRRYDAVMALRRGEMLSPLHAVRNPFVRDVLVELIIRARLEAVGGELGGMAKRAGLEV